MVLDARADVNESARATRGNRIARLVPIVGWARQYDRSWLRSDVIATLQQDHIALARAKGVPPRQIMTRHALRPSSFSLLTVAGLQLAQMVGGTVVIETLFGIPGLGALLIQSVLGHDLVMVQGVVVVIALGYLVINLIVDVSYRLLDPRVSV